MGGSRRASTNAASNALGLCAQCHTMVESKRAWAIVHGWLVQSHQDPAATRLLTVKGWVLHDDNGGVTL